jgi:hypothetical protein
VGKGVSVHVETVSEQLANAWLDGLQHILTAQGSTVVLSELEVEGGPSTASAAVVEEVKTPRVRREGLIQLSVSDKKDKWDRRYLKINNTNDVIEYNIYDEASPDKFQLEGKVILSAAELKLEENQSGKENIFSLTPTTTPKKTFYFSAASPTEV